MGRAGKVTGVWKRKSYGKVKPVKKREKKIVKPGSVALRKLYSSLTSSGSWGLLDNLSMAVQLWDPILEWVGHSMSRLTLPQVKAYRVAAAERAESYKATTDEQKIIHLKKAIVALEKMIEGHIRVPKLSPYLEKSVKKSGKLQRMREKIQPKYERLTKTLNDIFPQSGITFEVVPKVFDPNTNKLTERKFDHSRSTIYYSREYARALMTSLRRDGVLPIFIEESLYVSRAMSFTDHDGTYKPNHTVQVQQLHTLMVDFLSYSKTSTTAKLVRGRKKKRKIEKSFDTVVGEEDNET